MANEMPLGTHRVSWSPVRGIWERTNSLSIQPGTAPAMLASWPAWVQLTVPSENMPSLYLNKSQHLSSNYPNSGGIGFWEAHNLALFQLLLELTKPNL